MKRWDGLKDRFMEVYESRGLAACTVQMMSHEWDEWGCYLKNLRPRPRLDDVSAGMITEYIGRLLLVDGSKGRRERRVPLPPLAWQCLEAYLPRRQNLLAARGIFQEPALFVSGKGTRIKPDGLGRGMGNLTARAGVEATLHQLRHTCASELIADGAKLPHVQKLLGHKTLTTTMLYLHIAGPELAEAMRRHPICHLGQVLPTGGKTSTTNHDKEDSRE